MALVAPSTSPPSSQSLTRLAKRQDEACITTVWTTTWPAPKYDTCSLYQTLVPGQGAVPAVLCPRASQTPLSQPSQHQNHAKDSTLDEGTLTGILVAIAGLLILGITLCCILKRKPNASHGRRRSGKTRTARGRNGERQSHHGPGGRHHGGSRRSSARDARTGVLVGRSAQNNRQTGSQSRNQERCGFRTGAVKNQHGEGTHLRNKEPGTTGIQSASKTINRDHFRPAVSDQAPADASSASPVHPAQNSAETAESTTHERAVEDDQERAAAGTPEDANEEESNEEQVDGATHRQEKGGNEGPAEDGW